MNAQSIIDTLTAARDEALATAARCSEAIAVFVGASSSVAPARKPKPTAKAKQLRAPKKEKASADWAKEADDDEPRARKGRVAKKGVEQLYCATLKERQAKIGELKADGFRRIGPGEPLTSGTYDVRPSGDEDDSCVVLWRAKSEATA